MTVKATATVKGGFWPANGVSSLASTSGKGPWRRRIAQAFGSRQLLAQREIAETLDGVVPGSTALKTVTCVEPNAELGGKRVIETKTLVNRATVAGDVTDINADFLTLTTRTSFGANPVANKDGNPLGTR